jgi:hypothetical protein
MLADVPISVILYIYIFMRVELTLNLEIPLLRTRTRILPRFVSTYLGRCITLSPKYCLST